MNRKEVLEELTNLEIEQKYLKRQLDLNYYNKDKRVQIFNQIKDNKKKIDEVKFKLNVLKEMKK